MKMERVCVCVCHLPVNDKDGVWDGRCDYSRFVDLFLYLSNNYSEYLNSSSGCKFLLLLSDL